jgi:hypothetical protein
MLLLLSWFLTLLFLSSLLCILSYSIFSFYIFFLYQVASTSSILTPHGIIRHEPLWVKYDNQHKIRDNGDERDGVCCV